MVLFWKNLYSIEVKMYGERIPILAEFPDFDWFYFRCRKAVEDSVG